LDGGKLDMQHDGILHDISKNISFPLSLGGREAEMSFPSPPTHPDGMLQCRPSAGEEESSLGSTGLVSHPPTSAATGAIPEDTHFVQKISFPPTWIQLLNPSPSLEQRVMRDRAITQPQQCPDQLPSTATAHSAPLTEMKSNPRVAPAAHRSYCLRLSHELLSVFLPPEYDVVGYHNKSQLSSKPRDVLQMGKSICEGYAELFEHMCSLAGVHCKKLSGHAKGYGYETGQTFTGDSDHAWNAVYLEGRWHLLDSTWGSGSVDDSFTKFTYRYNEFYFLTHPALFINNHFPDNSNWQLLKTTLTLKEFENNMLHNSNFYMLGLLAAHPETPIIQTVKGKASISVDCRSGMLFMFKLKGTDEQGLMTLKKHGMKLDIYPQKTGSHKLEIFAKPSKAEASDDVYKCVLEYVVECESVDKAMRFPKDLHQPVGPSWFSERQGFLRPSHREPVLHTNDGRCSLTFTLGKDISVLTSLHTDGSSLVEDMGRRHVLQIRRGNQIELKVHLPHAGSFVLKIYSKKKSDPGNYDYIFNYLIRCLNTEVKWPAFPQRFSKWLQDYEIVEPLSGLLPANRNVQFKLKMHGIAKVLVQAENTYHPLTQNRGFWEGTCNTSGCREVSVMVHENANHTFYSNVLKYEVETQ
ncbi:KY peptidase, partial [Vireo altiloquus]|nr:KY peptidase [Vireo altiloquus]